MTWYLPCIVVNAQQGDKEGALKSKPLSWIIIQSHENPPM